MEAAGKVTLDRSTFKATGSGKGTLPCQCPGDEPDRNRLLVRWFRPALDIAAYNGSVVTVRQCLIAKTKAGEPAERLGLRVHGKPGGSANLKLGRRLVLDRCTILGKGAFDLAGFSTQMPYKVEAQGVQSWLKPSWPGNLSPRRQPPSDAAFQWLGQDNLFDGPRGKAWIVLSRQGTPELPDSPKDLDSWAKLVDESASVPSLLLSSSILNPKTSPKTASPQRISSCSTPITPVGADPDRVGPSGPRPPSSNSWPDLIDFTASTGEAVVPPGRGSPSEGFVVLEHRRAKPTLHRVVVEAIVIAQRVAPNPGQGLLGARKPLG